MHPSRPRVEPDTARVLEAVAALDLPAIHELDPAGARRLREKTAHLVRGDTETVGRVRDDGFQGPGGRVAVRIYEPRGGSPAGTLLYLHGGGWVLGDLDTHDALCRGLCNASGLRLVAVDYRRAPEHPHPAALEDATAGLAWAHERFPGALAIGGDSAGGHLATCVAARLRASGPSLAAQLLIYPVTDLSRFDTPSYDTFAEGYWLTRDAMAWFRGHLVPEGVDLTDPDLSPLYRGDLSGMPPTVLVTAECDVLRDEGHAYADALEAAGCSVERLEYQGVIHGFVAMPGAIAEGRRALSDMGARLRHLVNA